MRTSEVCLLGLLHFFLLYGRLLHAQKLDDDFQPESHKNWHLLPAKNECGLPEEIRVYGGYEPKLGSFPWIARIGYAGSGGSFWYGCGGSLISDYYVLTAAHCIDITAKIDHVRLGEHNALTNPDCQERGSVRVCAPPVQDIPVTKVIYHENYTNSLFADVYFDVGLLRLKSPPEASLFVQPVCLLYGAGMKMDFANANSSAAGWGTTGNSSLLSNVLQAVSLKVWNQDECVAIFTKMNNDRKALAFKDIKDRHVSGRFRNNTHQRLLADQRLLTIIESQVCAGGEIGKDTCKGDSGGPLMWAGSFDPDINNRTYLIGLTSMGIGCGSKTPGVYTRISSVMRWILDHIEE